MLELLGGDPEFYEGSSIPMPPELEACATNGFKEVDGCVVPSSFNRLAIFTEDKPRIPNQNDETGFECSIHDISVGSYFDSEVELEELARTGLDFAFILRRELLKSQIQAPFRFIISAQSADRKLGIGPTCTVRFHRIRVGQAWLSDNLEGYKMEAIAVLDFHT
jgi:hypothetical protein